MHFRLTKGTAKLMFMPFRKYSIEKWLFYVDTRKGKNAC
jgi:hypothetical protein